MQTPEPDLGQLLAEVIDLALEAADNQPAHATALLLWALARPEDSRHDGAGRAAQAPS